MMGAEVDFLDWMQLTVPALFSTLDGGHRYLKGFADAALKHGVSHQLCMSMPSQVMDSLLLPAVTNARASPDNTPTNENRWLIAYTSLMMWPLDVQPFADNVWSMSHEPAEPYGPGVFRHNVELQMLITTLTAGPVGIADEIGFTNATLVLQTCTANGTLLQPDKSTRTSERVPEVWKRPQSEEAGSLAQPARSSSCNVMQRSIAGIICVGHERNHPRPRTHERVVAGTLGATRSRTRGTQRVAAPLWPRRARHAGKLKGRQEDEGERVSPRP